MSNPSSLFDITNRVVVVTGATGVLAGSAARHLVAQGARVVFLARDQVKLDRALAEAKGLSGECVSYPCNVLDQAGLEKVRDSVVARYGRIDALINAAGGNQAGATISPDKSGLDLD